MAGMAYTVEVDQSGKIEDTSRDTALALTNGIRFSILVPSKVKRECLIALRSNGLSGQRLYLQLFATALFFMLRDYINELLVTTVDIEYVGREDHIKQHLYNLLYRAG